MQLLQQLVDERITEQELREQLDPEILALLVEESIAQATVSELRNILDSTLAHVQSSRLGLSTDILYPVFVSGATKILTDVQDESFRRVYSTTGLSSASCKVLAHHVEDNRDVVSDLLTSAPISGDSGI